MAVKGEVHILWVPSSNHVDRDQTPPKEQSNLGICHYRTVKLKGVLSYVSIDKYYSVHILGISTTAELCHANMTLANSMFFKLANSTDVNEMLPVWHLIKVRAAC